VQKNGFTTIELLVSSVVISILAISVFSAYIALNSVTIFAKQKIIGTEVATNQLEYIKSLPYDNLAVIGGAIPHPNPLPNSKTESIDGVNYVVKTSINYVDDAHDGCASYPDEATKNLLCRNLPSPTGSPLIDLNPADYKIVNVKVEVNANKVAELDTQISARVAETDSTTGALIVKVIDSAGNPVSGATAVLSNNTISPAINISDSTDVNGIAIFYGLTPDTGNDYLITANKAGYSSLSTIKPIGSLSPNFPSQNVVTQQSSSVTLTINPKGNFSVIGEVVDTSNIPIANLKIYAKGGPKKFSDDSDNSYYFDNMSPLDNRVTSDINGLFNFTDLDPGDYIFCGDSGNNGCQIGTSPIKYLVASVPYAGIAQIGPINIPNYEPSSPPSPTFSFNGNDYYQKVRLYFSSNINHPRITQILNTTASVSAGTHTFTIKGVNLPCNDTNPGLCGTEVKIKNNSNDIPTSCLYSDATATDISCTIDTSSLAVGQSNITLTANGYTIDIPNGSGLLGGLNVVP
jgi:hypothetical protein